MKFCIRILIIFSFVYFTASSQVKLDFRHYSVEDGLSQSTVQSIFQDNKGFLWIGTSDGLNRFDGYKFYQYNFNGKDTGLSAGHACSISDGFIKAIFQDNFGNLWIGTGKGLNKFIVKSKSDNTFEIQFVHFYSNDNDKYSLSNNEINVIYQTGNKDLWIGTANGLNRAAAAQLKNENNNRLKFVSYYADPSGHKSLSNNNISSITGDNNGNLWIGTFGGGLNKLDVDSGTFSNYLFDKNSLLGEFITSLYLGKNNILWIGTNNKGLIKFETENEKFTPLKMFDLNKKTENRISSITEDSEGNLWLAVFGTGVVKFNPVTEKFHLFRNDSRFYETIRNDFVRVIYIDNSNNLWAGTNETLEKASLNGWELFHYKNIPSNDNSLQDNHILSIYEDHLSNLWIGSEKGLDKLDFKKNKFVHYNIYHNTGSKTGFISAIYEDSDYDLWLGSFNGGLYKYDKTKNSFKLFLNDTKNYEAIISSAVTSLNEDAHGNILIGTNSGVYKFNKISKDFSNFILGPRDSALLSEKINTIYHDKEDNHWIGTSSGLININKDSSCIKYFHNKDDLNSITPGNINSICEDKKGNIWVGTDNGLNLLNKNSGKFIRFTTHNGLLHNGIKAILEDNIGNIWISSRNGLTKFNYEPGAAVKFRNYDISDGLRNFGFNNNAAFKNNDGILFFGGFNGFNFFDPSSINENKNLPRVVFTSFKKFDKEILSVDELSGIKKIVLEHSDKFFSFEFAALDFTQPAKHNYEYKMEGFDEHWIFSGNNRIASYTNLDPGEYIFKVKASNNDGIWNEEGAFIRLIINPPLWQTWWAYIFYFFALTAALYYIRRYELSKRKRKEEDFLKEEREKAELREAHLRAEKAELLAKAMESGKEIEKQNIRYRIASDLHDEIGSNLSSITLLSSILARRFKADPGLVNILHDINNAAKLSAESIRDIVWFINPVSDQLTSLISRMKETANMMVGNIDYYIDTFIVSDKLKIDPDIKRNVFLMYKEILNNIIKHSEADKVNILIREENNDFVLSVKDNGIGFDKEKAKMGNGLRNFKARAKQVHGELIIDSECGKGTFIQLKVRI